MVRFREVIPIAIVIHREMSKYISPSTLLIESSSAVVQLHGACEQVLLTLLGQRYTGPRTVRTSCR